MMSITFGFLVLSLIIAVMPAYQIQNNNPPLPNATVLNDSELRGKMIYISEGCQACHTQQVRSNIIDQVWGRRPSVPADYAENTRMNAFRNTASVLGSERTGPDLSNIGERQPADTWHYLHLYNPRAVVQESIMPAYPWLFNEVEEVKAGDREVTVPREFLPVGKHVITTRKAEDLVAYLKSLKQAPLPGYLQVDFDAYDWQNPAKKVSEPEEVVKPDGARLYATHCKVCHQDNGQGIKGAFPTLDRSEIVNQEDPTQMISIVLYGLDRDNEYGAMVGFGERLSDEEIAAIISFERKGWNNQAGEVTTDEVRKVREGGVPEDWPME